MHKLGIKYFHGVFMQDELPKKPWCHDVELSILTHRNSLVVIGYVIIKIVSGEYTWILSDKLQR